MSQSASKTPAGDRDKGCLGNLAQLSSVSCRLSTLLGPLTALSMQATKKADPKGPFNTLKGTHGGSLLTVLVIGNHNCYKIPSTGELHF